MKLKNQIQTLFAKTPRLVRWLAAGLVVLAVVFYFSLPHQLFRDPTGTVVLAAGGQMLGARIADDGQWRFPATAQVPEKFAACITHFEDRYFYRHPGVNPLALARALKQNLTAGHVVSGGSTLTMQTIRLMRKGKPRTILEKLYEIWLALRLECRYSKNEILALYASHAPFGGNVVGLDAAAWRYYGRSADNLSWAETAALAVLPNAPALIFPGRNAQLLLQKRNKLLDRLESHGIISATTCTLAKAEPLPQKPKPLPDLAFHLTERINAAAHGQITKTTLDAALQKNCNEVLSRHQRLLAANGIHNIAAMIVENSTADVLAYVGNISTPSSEGSHGGQVDVITSARSSGSILKPFLYAAMLDAGELLPGTLVADIPTTISNYSPRNFEVAYDGAVHADEALIRSLNVPAVRLLNQYGQPRFYHQLQQAGLSSLTFPAGHYGLSLILGGAEAKPEDLALVYRNMAATLLHYPDLQPELATKLNFFSAKEDHLKKQTPVFGAGAVYLTFEAMQQVRRPAAEAGWEAFLSSTPIAWKTGTSFGFRDAWAVGVTPGFTVVVWAGNADGEGRPGLTGLLAAAPVMFDLFDLLPATGWFVTPWDALAEVPVCHESGMRPSPFCNQTDSVLIPLNGLNSAACPWHHLLHLDAEGKHQVNAQCYPVDQIQNQPWFILPAAMAWYYRNKNPFYKNPPPWLPGCQQEPAQVIQIIRPDKPGKIFLPRETDGSLQATVFEAAHQDASATIFWYLDETFAGQTSTFHTLSLQPAPGKHILTLLDGEGNLLRIPFEIVGKQR